MPNNINEYLSEVQKLYIAGNATEHTYRPIFKQFVEQFQNGIRATNEPKRVECGAPDFIVEKKGIPLGFIECKDIGKSLDESEDSEQMKRYLPSLSNLILTDYLEFRYYVQGERKMNFALATIDGSGKIKKTSDGESNTASLFGMFFQSELPVVKNSKELAMRMAKLAQLLRDTITEIFNKESEKGTLHQQMEGFRDVLISDLTEKQFADMYAQTISYGLFAAICNLPVSKHKEFGREHASYDLPKTNPFLRSMFEHIAGPDLDDRLTWIVDSIVELLKTTDISAILEDFGKKLKKEDPVVHFYETFLAEYEKA